MDHGKMLRCAAAVSALCAALSASAQVVIEDTAKPGNSGELATSQQPAATQSQREGTTPATTRETTTAAQSGMSASGTQQSSAAQADMQYGTAATQSGTQSATHPSVRTNGSKLPPADARSRQAADAQYGVTSSASGQSGASTTGTTQAGQPGAAESTLSRADQKAIRDMAMANMAEVEMGRMAQSRSSSEQVKAFAQQMIDDHGKALSDVQSLAQDKGLTLPAELDAKHKREYERLDKLAGEAFDKAYVARAGVADHRTVHAALGRIRSGASDADVKAAADTMRPVVQQHLNAARQLNARVKSGKKEDTGSASGD